MLMPLVLLKVPVDDLYENHWSLTGQAVPDEKSADEAVFLPGRNVLLLSKGILWCHLHGVPALAQAVLRGNPFPDATESFYQRFEEVVNQAVAGSVRVLRPYAKLKKAEIMVRGGHIPAGNGLFRASSLAGQALLLAARMGAERHQAFVDAGLPDPTHYSAKDRCTA